MEKGARDVVSIGFCMSHALTKSPLSLARKHTPEQLEITPDHERLL